MSLISTLAPIIGSLPVVGDIFNRKVVIGRYANAAAPRPRPFSMAHPYTSWLGLTDRTWSGRHLPEADQVYVDSLPAEEDVVALFKRENLTLSHDTSIMFMFFAQWFTDSFLRTNFDDSRRNSSNHEIDLCQIYGLTEAKTHMLRSHEGGRLASQMIDGEEYPEFLFEEVGGELVIRDKFRGEDGDLHHPDMLKRVLRSATPERRAKVFAVGLEHGNATIGYTVLNALFLREHNRIAGLLAGDHPDWDDERLFQTTRNIMIVLLLKIVVEDYIRHISPVDFPIKAVVGAADDAPWGKPNWIAIEFNLLYRWHSLVPEAIESSEGVLEPGDFLHNNLPVLDRGVSAWVADFSRQKAGRIGLGNVPKFMFMADPGELSTVGRSIRITRDAKLRSMNAYREHFSMDRIASFEDLTDDPALAAKLKALYGDIDRVEWFVGMFAESYGEKGMMGDLLTRMVAHDAFTQALNNPLLSKNIHNEATFSARGMQIIKDTSTLKHLVRRNLGKDVYCSFKA